MYIREEKGERELCNEGFFRNMISARNYGENGFMKNENLTISHFVLTELLDVCGNIVHGNYEFGNIKTCT